MVRLTPLPTRAVVAAVALHAVRASNIITIKGTKFFDSVTKDQLFINGVAYQPRTLGVLRQTLWLNLMTADAISRS